MLENSSKEYLKAFSQMPDFYTMDPESVRAMMAEAPPVEVELAPLAKVEDRTIPVEDAEIKVRVYTPEGEGPFPIFVYYHGGGWVLGDLETADASCRMIANVTNHVVVSVDYRLSPEYKFPTPLNDAYSALEWVQENAGSIQGIADNIVVGGDSAGGNLATAVSIMDRDKGINAISAQVLIYPVTDLGYDTESYREFQKGFGLDKELMIWFGDHYIRNQADRENPLVAPLKAKNVSGLPKAFVVTAGYDVLRDEGQQYAARLKNAGVTVDETCEQGMVHGYFTNMAVFPDAIKRTIQRIDQFLKSN